MRILIPGGFGQAGTLLARHLHAAGHEVTVLSRNPAACTQHPWRTLGWDGRTPGSGPDAWAGEIDRSEAVINLTGRSVNCRFTPAHRREILDSRIEPTLLLCRLIAVSRTPPRVLLNASTATYYRHALDRPQDEFTGELGDTPARRGTREPAGLPETWSFSVSVAERWEQALAAVNTPRTRKLRLRLSMLMSPDPGGVFSVLSRLCRLGLGGTQGPGTQFISWMHDRDYCRAVDLLLEQPEIADETGGVVNLTAPGALENRPFMRILRRAWHQPLGLPAPLPALALGAFAMRTQTELVMKSRWVTPTLLRRHGFQFGFPLWSDAAGDLVARMRR